MAKLTMLFGVILIALGLWGFVATGSQHPTPLIPSYLGVILVVCGMLSLSRSTKRRMICMHVAVTLAFLGFLGTIPALVDAVRMMRGVVFPHPVAVEEKAAMSAICALFVVLCVRSFVAARRGRSLQP